MFNYFYWFDFRRKRIRNTGTIDKKYGRILHGPYQKIRGGQLIEKGIYFVGTKHGRWVKLDKNDILVDKIKFYKGWPKESLVKYYDDDRQKLKEVIPVVYGEIIGDYYFFHENGEIAVKGQYEYGEKIGRWTEYFDIIFRAWISSGYSVQEFFDNFGVVITPKNMGATYADPEMLKKLIDDLWNPEFPPGQPIMRLRAASPIEKYSKVKFVEKAVIESRRKKQ